MAEAKTDTPVTEIDELRKEINQLKKGLEELKEVVAEIRASLSDLQNPFAMLSPPPQTPSMTTGTTAPENERIEETEKTWLEEKPKIKIPVSGGGEELSRVIRKEEGFKAKTRFVGEKDYLSLEDLKGLISDIGRAIKEEVEERSARRGKAMDVRRVIRILKTIYSLRKSLPKESIENIVKLAEILGLITSDDKEVLDTVMSLVEDALKQDLTPDEQILVLYILMKNLGYVDENLEDEILKIVSGVILSKKKKAKETENEEFPHGVVGGS
ncbi:MAG: hypothetical protein GXO43_02080 [Crenarchaeota archaeon]|nr:hypothetical protein [Thermoproteota archaeon]